MTSESKKRWARINLHPAPRSFSPCSLIPSMSQWRQNHSLAAQLPPSAPANLLSRLTCMGGTGSRELNQMPSNLETGVVPFTGNLAASIPLCPRDTHRGHSLRPGWQIVFNIQDERGCEKRRYFPTFTQRWKRVKWKIPSRFFIFFYCKKKASHRIWRSPFFGNDLRVSFTQSKFFLLVKKCNKHMTLAWSEELVLLITFRCNSPHNMIFKAAMYMRPTSTLWPINWLIQLEMP